VPYALPLSLRNPRKARRSGFRAGALVALWLFSTWSTLSAQEVLGGQWRKSFRVDSTVTFSYQRGGDVSYIEDLDGDGWPEILMGETSSMMESVMAFSGRTGSFLWLRAAPPSSWGGGFGSRITPSIDLLHGFAPSIIVSAWISHEALSRSCKEAHGLLSRVG